MRILTKVVYENKEDGCEIIEQCNYIGLKKISFWQWITEKDMCGDYGATVCIWRIKYKK